MSPETINYMAAHNIEAIFQSRISPSTFILKYDVEKGGDGNF